MARQEFTDTYYDLVARFGQMRMHAALWPIDLQIILRACAMNNAWRMTEENTTRFIQGTGITEWKISVDMGGDIVCVGAEKRFDLSVFPIYAAQHYCDLHVLIFHMMDKAPLEMLQALQAVSSDLEEEDSAPSEEEESDSEDFFSDTEDSTS